MSSPTTQSLTLPVLGMTCASCQHHVEEALRSTAGVESARVDLMAHRASVLFDPHKTAPEALVAAIRGVGYDAVLSRSGEPSQASSQEHSAESSRKAGATIAAGAAAMLLAMPLSEPMGAADRALMRVLPWLYALPPESLRWTMLIVTAVLMAWAGRGIYSSAIR